MTLRPGLVVVLRGLTQRTDGRGNERKPLTLGKVVGGWKVRLRIGGAGEEKYHPRARLVDPASVVREATPHERYHGLVLDPLPTM